MASSPVYSTRFAAKHGGADYYYSVPDGYVGVIRYATAFLAAQFQPEDYQIYIDPIGVTIWQGTLLTVPANLASALAYWSGRVIIEAGERMVVHAGGDVDVTVMGYLLSLP